MSVLTDPGQVLTSSTCLPLCGAQTAPFGVSVGAPPSYGSAQPVLSAMRTTNAPDDFANYATAGTLLGGFILKHGEQLLILDGDKQTVKAIANSYDNTASVPFYDADGEQHNVPVEASFLPFQSASGAVANIAVI